MPITFLFLQTTDTFVRVRLHNILTYLSHIVRFLTRMSYQEEEVTVVELDKKAGQQLC